MTRIRSTHVALVLWASALCALAPASTIAGDFAVTVLSYTPAPGQFVNIAMFNNPARALGPPIGAGTITPDNTGVVTLGGFGGSLVLAFDHPVLDDPRNAHGLDFIVFGNAFWSNGDPLSRFGEAAVIEISLDANANGLPDDPWFLIPGSHLTPPVARQTQDWDNDPATATPPATLSWYPAGAPSPMTTSAFGLPAAFETFILVNPRTDGGETFLGYGDLSPTLILGDLTGATGAPADNSLTDPEDNPAVSPVAFYTVPDDPTTVGIDPGSGGGDAFDIAHAVDPATGAPANLPGFDFIRLTNGVNFVGFLGEVSPEIDAVADVRPPGSPSDLNGDGLVNGADLAIVLNAWGARVSIADMNADGVVNGADLAAVLNSWSPGP